MAVSMETQRLISVSLGKIAQSRGQRGGINLHKNLLVATVLHKARNAYILESYSYQHNLHRQKLLEQYQLQQNISGQKLESTPVVDLNKAEPGSVSQDCQLNVTLTGSSDCHLVQVSASPKAPVPDCYVGQPNAITTDPNSSDYQLGQTSTTPTEPMSRDSLVGQPGATLTGDQLSRSDVSSESATASGAPEPLSAIYKELISQDKENSPPFGEDVDGNNSISEIKTSSFQDGHLAAAVQLSQDAQMTSSCEHNLKQQTSTSGSTTCNVLKRRRDNRSASSHEFEIPVSKIARLLHNDNSTPTSYSNFNSSDDSSRSDLQISNTSSSDSHQILNLVNIFNSGFSGLCAAASNSQLHGSSYQSEFDISNSQSHTRKIATKAG